MHIDDLLAPLPAPLEVTAADVRAEVDPTDVLIVLDDDPTGTQSVANLPCSPDGSAPISTRLSRQAHPPSTCSRTPDRSTKTPRLRATGRSSRWRSTPPTPRAAT
ncbi:hypothetical protein [Microbacterium sp. Se63.02b]|uniref:hypothetical protein n=1 Tax=Microbacterium sp. Se63.02b TaxID=2709304 RepID=UPI0031F6D1D5